MKDIRCMFSLRFSRSRYCKSLAVACLVGVLTALPSMAWAGCGALPAGTQLYADFVVGQTANPSALADATEGVLVYDPATDILKYCDGTSWFTLGTTGSGVVAISDADGDTQIQVEEDVDDDTIRFDTAGVEQMVIDENGNVQIGSVAQNNVLSVFQNANAFRLFGSNHVYMELHPRTGEGRKAFVGFPSVGSDDLRLMNEDTGRLDLGTSGLLRLSVSFDGDIGIGTTSPAASLEVAGTDSILFPRGTTAEQPSSPVNGMMRYNLDNDKFEAYQGGSWGDIITSVATTVLVADADGDTQIQVEESADDDIIRFDTAGAERMVIDENGGVVIGASNITAGAMLDIRGGEIFVDEDNNANGGYIAEAGLGGIGFVGNMTRIDSPDLYVSDAGGVGIGDVTPSEAKLVVRDTTNNAIFIVSDVNNGADILFASQGLVVAQHNMLFHIDSNNDTTNAQFVFSKDSALGTGSVELMRIEEDGTVGIGTASPEASLDVGGTDSILFPRGTTAEQPAIPVNGMMRYNSDNDNFEVYQAGAWTSLSTDGAGTALELADADGDTLIQVEEGADEDIIRFDTAGVERMVIDENGNVGIGRASESGSASALVIEGGIQTYVNTGVSALTLNLKNGTNTRIDFRSNLSGQIGSINIINDSAAFGSGEISFETKNNGSVAERVRIDRAGNLGIGTSTPEATFDVASTDSILFPRGSTAEQPSSPVNGMMRYNSDNDNFEVYQAGAWTSLSTDGAGSALAIADADNDTKIQVEETADDDTIRFDTAGTERMVIDAGGDVTVSQGGLQVSNTGNSLLDFYIDTDNDDSAARAILRIFEHGDDVTGSRIGTFGYNGIDQNLVISHGNINDDDFVIASDGSVGIGTTAPLEALQIHDAFTFRAGGAGAANIYFNGYWDTVDNRQEILGHLGATAYGAYIGYGTVGGLMSFNVGQTSGDAGDPLNAITAMSIDRDGHVGVGTASPEASATMTVESLGGDSIHIEGATTDGADIYISGGGFLSAENNLYLSIDSNSNTSTGVFGIVKDVTVLPSLEDELFQVSETGQVSVGPDFDGTFTVTGAPDITGVNTVGEGGIVIQNVAGDSSGFKMRIDANEIQGSDDGVASDIIFQAYGGNVNIGTDGGSEVASIDMNENTIFDLIDPITASGAATKSYVDTAVSDRRLKRDIQALESNALESVIKLRPVTYDWITPTDDVTRGKQYGFIAQEVGEVFPDLIRVKDDEIKTVTYKHRELVPFVVKAIQELKALVDRSVQALKDDNKALRGEVDALRAQNEDILKRLDALEAAQ